jgi:hypothetical protein
VKIRQFEPPSLALQGAQGTRQLFIICMGKIYTVKHVVRIHGGAQHKKWNQDAACMV